MIRNRAGSLSASRRPSPSLATALAVQRSASPGVSRIGRVGRVGGVSRIARAIINPDCRAGHDIWRRVARPLVVCDSGVARPVETWDSDERARGTTAASGDPEVRTLHVELSSADVTLVNGDVLHADKVVTGRDAVRDSELDAVILPCAPVVIDAWVTAAETRLVHLEPVTRPVVTVQGARCPGHVDKARAGMLDELIVPELEANPTASSDSVGLCSPSSGTFVATQVWRVDNIGSEGGHVGVGVPAHVCVVTTDGLTVDDELAEDVMTLRERRREHREHQRTLHDDGTDG